MLSTPSFFLHLHRLSKSLDRLGPEVFFWQSKISEVLGGSGYNSDRLSTPYIPQLTGTHHPGASWRTGGKLVPRSAQLMGA